MTNDSLIRTTVVPPPVQVKRADPSLRVRPPIRLAVLTATVPDTIASDAGHLRRITTAPRRNLTERPDTPRIVAVVSGEGAGVTGGAGCAWTRGGADSCAGVGMNGGVSSVGACVLATPAGRETDSQSVR